MDGVGAGGAGGGYQSLGIEIVVGVGQADPRVGLGDIGCRGVRVGVDRDGAQAEAAAGGEDPAGDLAAVGNQYSSKHQAHIRKTPKFDVPLISAFAMADRHIPNTVRVSRGSITPSSYNIPDKTIGSDSASIWPSTAARIAASASSSTC